MKDNEEIHNLDELYKALYRLNSSLDVIQKLEALNVIIEGYKKATDPIKRAQLEQTCLKEIKNTQIDVIKSMIECLGLVLESTKPTLKDKNSEATSLVNEPVGNLENKPSAFATMFNNVFKSTTKPTTKPTTEPTTDFEKRANVFITDLLEKQLRIQETESRSIKELNSFNELIGFNKLIDDYTVILSENNGHYPTVNQVNLNPEVTENESTSSNHEHRTQAKKKKGKTIICEVVENEAPNNLQKEIDSLDAQIIAHDQTIKDALVKYEEAKKRATSPEIIAQIELLHEILENDIPHLTRDKEQTINETEWLLNSSSDTGNKERSEALRAKYLKEYGNYPNITLLRELLCKQKKEYIQQITNLEVLIEAVFSKIKEIELLELNNKLDQYHCTVEAIENLRAYFEKTKNVLVNDEPNVQNLINLSALEFGKAFDVQQEARGVDTKPEEIIKEGLTDPNTCLVPDHALESVRIGKGELSDASNEKLCAIKDTLTLSLSELDSAQKEAEKSRVEELDKANFNINQQINNVEAQLQVLLKPFEQAVIAVIIPKYVSNFNVQAVQLIQEVQKKMDELPNLSKKELVNTALALQNELTRLTKAIEDAIKFENTFTDLQTQLSNLANESGPSEYINEQKHNQINNINTSLINERQNYNQNSCSKLDEYKKTIADVQQKQRELMINFESKQKSQYIKSLDQLLKELGAININLKNDSHWTSKLEEKLTTLRMGYLNSEISLPEFKEQSAQALSDIVTKDNLSKLTNDDEKTTLVGNFVRALADFITAIGYSICRQERPRYNPQFFASKNEKEYANKVSEIYQDLIMIGGKEEQISQPQQEISVKA